MLPGTTRFTGVVNGTYTVTPGTAGFTVSPASQPVTVNGANVTGVNFTATAQAFNITGTISGGAGVTVTLSGGASATTTADSSGNYSFAGYPIGSYTITPAQTGLVFTPTSIAALCRERTSPTRTLLCLQSARAIRSGSPRPHRRLWIPGMRMLASTE